jgi:CelD/BcsL family acetyltransferase involved in cellulose biosynthesis
MKWRTEPAAQLAAYARQWEALHRASGAHALLAFDFVAPLLREFGTGRELLAICEQDGAVVAMTIVVRARRGSWGSFQPPQAPVGLWLQGPGLELEALLAALLRVLPGYPLVFGLTQMDPALMPRPAATPQLGTLDYIDTARVTLAGGFDAYWNARGKNLRANLKKQRARLEKTGMAPSLRVSRDPADMAQAVADFGRLEGSGWKEDLGTAVHADDAQGRYYRAMLEALCRRGAASVYRYFFGERLVAMDLCVEDDGCIVVLKTAYDETAPQGFSPALLMREEATRALFDEGRLGRIEFYGRVMEWHLRWTDEVRTMYHVNYYRWPGLRRAHAMLQSRARKPAAGETVTTEHSCT